ncbi:MAG: C10 family peptidase [Alloprevotella sp.]|nr:C10 family peptidase [Alloprevotella sp.]
MKHLNRLYIALLASGIAAIPAMARTLSPDEALVRALGSDRQQVGLMSRGSGQSNSLMKLTHTGPLVGSGKAPAYYVYEEQGRSASGNGFLIASADDRLRPVLGIADVGTFAQALEQENTRWWLSQYEEEINAYLDSPRAQDDALSSRAGSVFDNYAKWTEIKPLVKSEWAQHEPYNNLCPLINGKRALTGCVQTATAQIIRTLRYYKGQGSNTLNGYDGQATFNYAAWEPNWDLMLDKYTGSSASNAQNEEVAKLNLACGVAASGIAYGLDATSAYSPVPGIVTYMGYDSRSRRIDRSGYRTEVWEEFIYENLKLGRPLMYSGKSNGGHAFVCDGYKDNGLFHINWGWDGSCDGNFSLSALNPVGTQGEGASDSGYNFYQAATIFVVPGSEVPELPEAPVTKPCNVVYAGGLPMPIISGAGTMYYGFKGGNFRFTEQNTNLDGMGPMEYGIGIILRNADDSNEPEVFVEPMNYIKPSKFQETEKSFNVELSSIVSTLPGTRYLAYPGFCVTDKEYVGKYWQVATFGGTPKQDHWLLTLQNDGKGNYIKNFALADRLNPGIGTTSYSATPFYQYSEYCAVSCDMTNISGSDFTSTVKFGIENEDGQLLRVFGAPNYIFISDGETRKVSSYFANIGNNGNPINEVGKYRLRLFDTAFNLPFDDNYLEVEILEGSGTTNGKGDAPMGQCEIGYWVDGKYAKPSPISIALGDTYTFTTSISPNLAQEMEYSIAIYDTSTDLDKATPIWIQKVANHRFTCASQHMIGDVVNLQIDNIPSGSYTMAFIGSYTQLNDYGDWDGETYTNVLLSFPTELLIGEMNNGILYIPNEDKTSLKAYRLATGENPKEMTVADQINGKKVTTLGSLMFDGNKTIESVVLPASITKVEPNAFRGTINLRSVVFNGPTVPYDYSATAFYGTNSDLGVFVPEQYYNAYAKGFQSSGTLYKIATELKASSSSLSMVAGESKVISFTVTPADNVRVEAISSDESTATASVDGTKLTVNALKGGESNVTLIAGGGVANPIEIKVKVNDSGSQEPETPVDPTDLKYDLNNDKAVNVGDVTFLVGRILQNDQDPRYDLDGKKGVSVGDVTFLVGIILKAQK